MKQELKNKLIFVAGSVFGLVILGALIQVVGAQQYQWAPPTDSFPNANTGIPIDTGDIEQPKKASIRFEVNSGAAVKVSDGSWIGNTDGTAMLIFGLGSAKNIIKMYGAGEGGGFALPSTGSVSNELEGVLRYNVGGKKVQFNDGTAWKDVGTGSGEGYWKYLAAGGIYYTEDASPGMVTRVVISDSEVQSNFAWERISSGDTSAGTSGSLPCDSSPLTEDCPNPYPAGSGALGDKKYDQWEYEYCLVPSPAPSSYGCDQYATQVQYNIYEYRSSVSTPSNGSELIVGQIKAKDITLDDPKWSKSQSVSMTGTRKLSMDDYVENWVVCPNGYFMSGFRFGRDGDSDLNAVIQCSKL